jgi:hypothetical protein
MFHCTRLERNASDKHSILQGPFVSYKEKLHVVNTPPAPYLLNVCQWFFNT